VLVSFKVKGKQPSISSDPRGIMEKEKERGSCGTNSAWESKQKSGSLPFSPGSKEEGVAKGGTGPQMKLGTGNVRRDAR